MLNICFGNNTSVKFSRQVPENPRLMLALGISGSRKRPMRAEAIRRTTSADSSLSTGEGKGTQVELAAKT
jgi:hypothetical protein